MTSDALSPPAPVAVPGPETVQWILRAAVEQSPQGFVLFSAVRDASGEVTDFRYRYLNPAAERLILRSATELLGTSLLAAFPGHHETGLFALYALVARTGEPREHELHYTHEGIDTWFTLRVAPAADGIAVHFTDISDRKRAEAALLASERQHRFLAESMPQIVWTAGPDGALDYVNQSLADYLGTSVAVALGTGWHTIVHPDDLGVTVSRWMHSVATGDDYQVEHRVRRRDGVYRWFLVRGVPMRDASGQVIKWFGTSTDVDDIKRTDVALRASEQRFRTLADTMPLLAWYANPDGHIPWYNQRWYEYTGTTLETVAGWGWDTVHDPDDLPRVTANWQAALSHGTPWEDTFRLRRHDGAWRWFLSRAFPLRDADGNIVRWFGTNVDIDDQKRAEASQAFLARAGRELTSSLDHDATLRAVTAVVVPVMADVAVIDLVEHDGTVRRARVQFSQRLPRGLEEGVLAIAPVVDDLSNPVARVMATRASLLIPEVSREDALRRVRGEAHKAMFNALGLVSLAAVPLNARGNLVGVLTVIRSVATGGRFTAGDVGLLEELGRRAALALDNARLYTTLQQEQQRVEEANRAKDAFLAVVSHELRTPLTAILGWVVMLRAGTVPEAKQPRALEVIERNTRAQARLVEELLDYTRIVEGKVRLNVGTVDVAWVVEQALESVRPAAEGRGVTVHAVTDPLVGTLTGDTDRVQQVLWNLLTNAVKFTPRGGRVTVAAHRVSTSVEITVTDTGQGFPPSFAPHLFERFRQADGGATRLHGGLGLGLAIVRHLVELHGGQITGHSDGANRGAVFTVRLPASPSSTAGPSVYPFHRESLYPPGLPAECPPTLDGLRVLVVEDDPSTCEMLASMLSRCGARVITAGSVAEALAVFGTRPPDVLLSDVGLPGETGYELMRRVRTLPMSHGGRVPSVALTAFARTEDRQEALEAGFDHHVAKPVEPAELLAIVARLSGR